MSTYNQRQISHLYYATLVEIKAVVGGDNHLTCRCGETNLIYGYEKNAGSLAPNDIDILITGDGGDTRWVSINAVGVGLTSVTYSALSSMILAATLTPGSLYEITDYQTKQLISGTTTIEVGSVEPIVVFALTSSTLSSHAQSVSRPQDILMYDPTKTILQSYPMSLYQSGVSAGDFLIAITSINTFTIDMTTIAQTPLFDVNLTMTLLDGSPGHTYAYNGLSGLNVNWSYSVISPFVVEVTILDLVDFLTDPNSVIISVEMNTTSIETTGIITYREDLISNNSAYFDYLVYKSRRYALEADTYATCDTIAAYPDTILITADNTGSRGNITIPPDGFSSLSDHIAAWNAANPANTVTLTSGDGSHPLVFAGPTLTGGAGCVWLPNQTYTVHDIVSVYQTGTDVALFRCIQVPPAIGTSPNLDTYNWVQIVYSADIRTIFNSLELANLSGTSVAVPLNPLVYADLYCLQGMNNHYGPSVYDVAVYGLPGTVNNINIVGNCSFATFINSTCITIGSLSRDFLFNGASYLTFGDNVTHCTVDNNSTRLTIGDNCESLNLSTYNVDYKIGNNCKNIVIGNFNKSISVGNSVTDTIVGVSSDYSKIGNNCSGCLVIGNDNYLADFVTSSTLIGYYNRVLGEAAYITCLAGSNSNVFHGSGGGVIQLGLTCSHNTFDVECAYITLPNGSTFNTFAARCQMLDVTDSTGVKKFNNNTFSYIIDWTITDSDVYDNIFEGAWDCDINHKSVINNSLFAGNKMKFTSLSYYQPYLNIANSTFIENEFEGLIGSYGDGGFYVSNSTVGGNKFKGSFLNTTIESSDDFMMNEFNGGFTDVTFEAESADCAVRYNKFNCSLVDMHFKYDTMNNNNVTADLTNVNIFTDMLNVEVSSPILNETLSSRNETQLIKTDFIPTGGTWTLGYFSLNTGYVTTDLANNANAAAIQAAMVSIAGNVSVTPVNVDENYVDGFIIEYTNAFALQPMYTVIFNSSLTYAGGAVTGIASKILYGAPCTILPTTYPKKLVEKPAGGLKLIYFDDTDNFAFADLLD